MGMLTESADIRDLDRRAVLHSVALVRRIGPADLARPTPCQGWTLADLLAHLTAQHRGFAAAAREAVGGATGGPGDEDVWAVRPDEPDPVDRYEEAAHDVIAAFAADGVPTARFRLPEITTAMTFAGTRAIGFHFIDYVVHSWDVARTLDLPVDLPADLVAAGLPIARAVPNGPERLTPAASFAPALSTVDEVGPLNQILALLGRSPDWTP
jgi:uncharacterized protein (TIGR03086 family)